MRGTRMALGWLVLYVGATVAVLKSKYRLYVAVSVGAECKRAGFRQLTTPTITRARLDFQILSLSFSLLASN